METKKENKKRRGIINAGVGIGTVSLIAAFTPNYNSLANILTNTLPTTNLFQSPDTSFNTKNYSLFDDFMNLLSEYEQVENATPDTTEIDSTNKTLSEIVMPNVYDPLFLDSIANSVKDAKEFTVDSILQKKEFSSEIVDYYFIKASIFEESRYNPRAVSKKHLKNYKLKARGLGQFMEGTWQKFGNGNYLNNVFDPEKNIDATINYYNWLEKFVKENHPRSDTLSNDEIKNFIIAAYNGGHNRLNNRHWRLENMPDESKKHVIKVNNTINYLKDQDKLRSYAQADMQLREQKEQELKKVQLSYTQIFKDNHSL